MTKDEALKLALETLEYAGPSWIDARQPAITAIKEALAQPEQEPYCYTYTESGEEYFAPPTAYVPDNATPLYTTPPQRKPLTFEQVEDCFPEGAIFAEDDGWLRVSAQTLHDFARAIEAAHGVTGEKNGTR